MRVRGCVAQVLEPEPEHEVRRMASDDLALATIDEYMQQLVERCGTVKDPLSGITLDITKQCVSVSLAKDGIEQVRLRASQSLYHSSRSKPGVLR